MGVKKKMTQSRPDISICLHKGCGLYQHIKKVKEETRTQVLAEVEKILKYCINDINHYILNEEVDDYSPQQVIDILFELKQKIKELQ